MKLAASVPLRQAVSALLGRKVSFNADGLICFHGADFLNNPEFARAYRVGVARLGEEVHLEWRVRVALWAASQGMKLEGDFVECGVNTGILTGAILDYLNWNQCSQKTFYLLDTFGGIPLDGLSTDETEVARARNEAYSDVFDVVREHFSKYRNVVLVKGAIPGTLPQVTSERVAYLSIDLNMAAPEMAVAEYFWHRLVPGAIVVLDDYNYAGYLDQRRAWNGFAERAGIDILPLPTGQGLIVKPPDRAA